MKFFEWFEQYHSVYCVDEISFDCYKEYEYINQKHFTHIHNLELGDIKPIDIQICLKTTNAYSSDRKRKTYFLVKRVLREAIVNGLILSNPVDNIKPPQKTRKDIRCFNISHLEMLFDNDCAESRMFQFALWTGLRRGELLALHWDNIDIKNSILHVCQTLVRTSEGDVIKHTTKGRCDRIVPLHKKAVSLLKRIHSLDSDKGFLFCKAGSESPLKLRAYNRLYSKYYKKQQEKHKDLPYYTPHNLRLSYATYMLQSGADVNTLRVLLGHVDISTTQRYIHTNLQQMRIATNKLDLGSLNNTG